MGEKKDAASPRKKGEAVKASYNRKAVAKYVQTVTVPATGHPAYLHSRNTGSGA